MKGSVTAPPINRGCDCKLRAARRLFNALWAAQLLGLLLAPRLLGGAPSARRWRAAFTPPLPPLRGGLGGRDLGLMDVGPSVLHGGAAGPLGSPRAGARGPFGPAAGAPAGVRALARQLAGAAVAAAAAPAVALCDMAEDVAVWWPLVRVGLEGTSEGLNLSRVPQIC